MIDIIILLVIIATGVLTAVGPKLDYISLSLDSIHAIADNVPGWLVAVIFLLIFGIVILSWVVIDEEKINTPKVTIVIAMLVSFVIGLTIEAFHARWLDYGIVIYNLIPLTLILIAELTLMHEKGEWWENLVTFFGHISAVYIGCALSVLIVSLFWIAVSILLFIGCCMFFYSKI